MALETLEFDAAGSNVDGTNPGTALVVMSAASNYYVTAFSSPAPAPKLLWASSIDTDGARRADPASYENRQVTMTVEVKNDTSSSSTHEDALKSKVAKLHREGGTLKWTRKDGSVRIFDLLASDGYTTTIDLRYENGRAEIQLSFLALPGMRGSESDLGDNTETTLTSLIFTEASIPGDLTGPGRLVIDNDGTIPWWGAWWGVQSRYYDSATSAALFYQAEGRTAMGGSAIAAGPSGASGAGSNVMRNTSLLTSYQAVMSTQATGGGAHLSNVGTFRFLARAHVPATNTGSVSVALSWGEGDFGRFQQNTAVTIPTTLEGSLVLLDLGLVAPRKVISGTQRWEGRILAKSTVAGDDIDIDAFELIPADEGSGRAEGVLTIPAPTSVTGRDEFTGMAVGGALNARVAPAGGTWATSGAATDFAGNAGFPVDGIPDTVRRAATGVRYAVLGATNYTNVASSVWANTSAFGNATEYVGVLARWVDASNYLTVRYTTSATLVEIVIGGTATTLDSVSSLGGYGPIFKFVLAASTAGDYIAQVYDAIDDLLLWQSTGAHTALATGGALATGKPGFIDNGSSSGGGPFTHDFDNFAFWVPVMDAGVFNGQSLQVRHDGVFREDSAGAVWQNVSSYEGDYLRVPAAGPEARTARFIIRPIYHPPSATGVYLDDRIDDMSARAFVTGRYL